MQRVDLAIVGAGIVGLAHAVHAVRAGLSVTVIERDPRARGASVRNFGMLAIVAQSPGAERESALQALGLWKEIGKRARFSVEQAGCLFIARRSEEMSVLEEAEVPASNLISARNLSDYAPSLRTDAVLGGLWSPDAWKVDQRQATARIADWLAREHGVAFRFSTEVKAIDAPQLETSRGPIMASHAILCGGDEFRSLFPEAFAETGVARCQLQMLRTKPQPRDWRLKPFLLGGLSLTRYSAFAACASLPALKERQRE